MIKSKVIDALKSLNKKELSELGDFINSPFHNKNKNLRKLFDFLKPFYPSFTAEKFSKELLYQKLFPANPYADKTIRNLFSDLQNLIESYLAHKLFDSSKFINQYFRISAASKQGLTGIAQSSIRKTEKMLSDFSFDGGNIFFYMHLIEMEKDFLKIGKNILINLNMKEGEYLIYAFISKYLIFKMKYYNYQYKLGTEKLSEFIEKFESEIDLGKFIEYLEKTDIPLKDIILIYYYCTRFMSNLEEDSFYFKVKNLLNKNKNIFSRTEIINLYLTFNGYCIAKMRAGEKEYSKELLSIYKEMIEQKLAIGEGESFIHITLFNNIVGSGLGNNETVWTRTFIEEYSRHLIPEFKDTMYNYALAQYFFKVNEFNKALEHIGKVNFENYNIKNGSRILLLKIYYELEYTESFFSLCDSIKHYLAHDKQVPEDVRNSNGRFVSYISRVYKLKMEPSSRKADELINDIVHNPSGTNDQWLTDKISVLAKK